MARVILVLLVILANTPSLAFDFHAAVEEETANQERPVAPTPLEALERLERSDQIKGYTPPKIQRREKLAGFEKKSLQIENARNAFQIWETAVPGDIDTKTPAYNVYTYGLSLSEKKSVTNSHAVENDPTDKFCTIAWPQYRQWASDKTELPKSLDLSKGNYKVSSVELESRSWKESWEDRKRWFGSEIRTFDRTGLDGLSRVVISFEGVPWKMYCYGEQNTRVQLGVESKDGRKAPPTTLEQINSILPKGLQLK